MADSARSRCHSTEQFARSLQLLCQTPGLLLVAFLTGAEPFAELLYCHRSAQVALASLQRGRHCCGATDAGKGFIATETVRRSTGGKGISLTVVHNLNGETMQIQMKPLIKLSNNCCMLLWFKMTQHQLSQGQADQQSLPATSST